MTTQKTPPPPKKKKTITQRLRTDVWQSVGVTTVYVWKETRPKFEESQDFYFHFHCKSICVKAVHLS